MIRSISPGLFAISILSAFLLSGCDNEELPSLRNKVESMSNDIRSERNRNEDLQRRYDVIERDFGKMKLQLQDAQSDRDKLNDTLKKLDKEFSDYKEKYKAAVLKKIPGLPLPEIVVNKKTFQGLTIRRIDDDGLTLDNLTGIIRVKRDDVSEDLGRFLALNQKTPVQSQVSSILREVQDHIDGKTTGQVSLSGVHGAYRQYADVLQSVAILKNDEMVGSGFVAKQEGKTYFFTNAHMVGGKNLKAQIIMGPDNIKTVPLPKEMEVSDDDDADDIVRFELPDTNIVPLQIAEKTDKLMPDQFIMALGNSEGAGVIPCIKGRTGGVGISWVEIDAPVTHGNSGGPVVLDGRKTVVGVVTKYERALPDHTLLPGSSSTGIRRLCIRPERVEKWRHVSQDRIAKELQTIKQIDTDTKILSTLQEFRFTGNHSSGLYRMSYVQPRVYVLKESELANILGHMLIDLERNIKADETYYDNTKNNLFTAKLSTRAMDDQLKALTRSTQQKVKDHVGTFVNEVSKIYDSGINGLDATKCCAFDRKMFVEVIKEREKMVALLRKHLAEELREFEFNTL